MDKTTLKAVYSLSKDELLVLSYDFINLNRDATNEQIPYFLLEFWSMPNYAEDIESNDISLLIFRYILCLDSKSRGQEKIKTVLGTYRFSQLFHVFQVILATTIYCRKYQLSIEPFQMFKIEKYNIPKLEGHEQLLQEYLRLIKPVEFKYRKKGPNKKYQLEITIVSKSSSLIFIEYFIDKLISHYYLSYELSERMSRAIMATVNYAISYVAVSGKGNSIHVGVVKNINGFSVTVLCGPQSMYPQRHKFNPPRPIDSTDIKGGYLYSMKYNTDKISFLNEGAEVALFFCD